MAIMPASSDLRKPTNNKTKSQKARKPISIDRRARICEACDYTCQLCGKDLIAELEIKNRIIDHIHPLSRNGTNQAENLWLLCRTCDQRKGNQLVDELNWVNEFGRESVNNRQALILVADSRLQKLKLRYKDNII